MHTGRLATVTKRITTSATGEVTIGTREGFQTRFASTNDIDREFLEGATVMIVESPEHGILIVTDPSNIARLDPNS